MHWSLAWIWLEQTKRGYTALLHTRCVLQSSRLVLEVDYSRELKIRETLEQQQVTSRPSSNQNTQRYCATASRLKMTLRSATGFLQKSIRTHDGEGSILPRHWEDDIACCLLSLSSKQCLNTPGEEAHPNRSFLNMIQRLACHWTASWCWVGFTLTQDSSFLLGWSIFS